MDLKRKLRTRIKSLTCTQFKSKINNPKKHQQSFLILIKMNNMRIKLLINNMNKYNNRIKIHRFNLSPNPKGLFRMNNCKSVDSKFFKDPKTENKRYKN